MSTGQNAWRTARKILCVRLDYLGDVLMTTPALRALRQDGARSITLLTSPGGAAVTPYLQDVDETIVYAAPWLKHGAPANPGADLAMIESLRGHAFDAAVIFTVYSQNPLPAALLCHLAGIPLRLAYCRENPYRLLTDWIPESEPERQVRHEVRRQLDLVASVGAACRHDERMTFRVPDSARARVQDLLAARGIGSEYLVLHPGASAPSRRYPPDRFRQAAQLLAQASARTLVFTGSSDEAALIDEIREGLPASHSLAGRLDLGELGALIAGASVLVSNNTGPAHLAAALGTPVVDLYALTNPQHTPWQVPARVLFEDVSCRYCYKSVCPEGHQQCLAGVPPERVAQAALELLRGATDTQSELPPLAGLCVR